MAEVGKVLAKVIGLFEKIASVTFVEGQNLI
jgi:hypothetical protein